MVKNNDYNKCLNKAKYQLIDMINLTKDERDSIITDLSYISNWNGFTKKYNDLLKDDNLLIKENDKEYKFSKKHFLTNKFFAKELGISFKKQLGDVYTKIIVKDDNLIIKITKNRRKQIYNNINFYVEKSP